MWSNVIRQERNCPRRLFYYNLMVDIDWTNVSSGRAFGEKIEEMFLGVTAIRHYRHTNNNIFFTNPVRDNALFPKQKQPWCSLNFYSFLNVHKHLFILSVTLSSIFLLLHFLFLFNFIHSSFFFLLTSSFGPLTDSQVHFTCIGK